LDPPLDSIPSLFHHIIIKPFLVAHKFKWEIIEFNYITSKSLLNFILLFIGLCLWLPSPFLNELRLLVKPSICCHHPNKTGKKREKKIIYLVLAMCAGTVIFFFFTLFNYYTFKLRWHLLWILIQIYLFFEATLISWSLSKFESWYIISFVKFAVFFKWLSPSKTKVISERF